MDCPLQSDKSQVFAHADPHAVSEYVNRHVGSHCILMPNHGKPSASLSHRPLANLDLCRISYGGSVRVTSSALGTLYHLQILLKGHCLWRGGEGEHHFIPGELLLINPDDPVDLTYSDDCEKLIVKIPASFLDKACSDNQWRRPSEGIRFSPRHNLGELDGFSSLLGLVCDEAESEHALPLIQEKYASIIAGKLLALLKSNVSYDPLSDGNPSFEHLSQFIEENIKKDINLEHLAQLGQMSLRSLYALFEKSAGTTPRQYIRQRKLESIRNSLSDPRMGARSITEISLDYGFLHLGRFAENYKKAFGELPSETLRRHS
ncbi:MAG: AraC family transcriptional regulator [Pseudomonas sagittaria]|nr:AraC family transcriptional regulator [Pseudomonas sagittaria]MCM2330291.1 AraC family transcriptional regulator [Pseudomonas sagittaria]